MPNYRRAKMPGATYFFTVVLAERGSGALVEHVDLLRWAIRTTLHKRPFRIDAMVVLPDHLHAVWTLPEGDADFPTRWRLIKARFSRGLPKSERISVSHEIKRERGIWQRRYWEHRIRDDGDYRRHVKYCHFNPVKHGLVARVRDWPHSSFHRDVRAGVFPLDWVGDVGEIDGAGEP